MSAPNLLDLSSVVGRTAALAVTTSATAIISNAANSNTVIKVVNLLLTNVNGTTPATANVDLFRSNTRYMLIQNITVPPGAALTALAKDSGGMYLEEGDALRVQATLNADLVATAAYEVVTRNTGS